MIMRWDGCVGFAGGDVEAEEAADAKAGAVAVRAAAEKALRRELREEVGVTEAGELEHICTHLTAANGSRSHFWAREVDVEKFIEIESGVRRGMHFGCEVMGAFRAPLFPGQLESFFRSNFPPGAQAQLLIFLSKKNLIPAADLEAAVQVRALERVCCNGASSPDTAKCRVLGWSHLRFFSRRREALDAEAGNT
jgi:8-oxo-dGTP pyrophosphatase MutT (NUDIX family)